MSYLIDLEDRNDREESEGLRRGSGDRNYSLKLKRLLNGFIQKWEEAGQNRRLKVSKSSTAFEALLERVPFYAQYCFLTKLLYKDCENQLKSSSLLLNEGKPYTVLTQGMRIAGLILIQELQK